MRKIAVLNQKGGVGKTTTAVNIAAALAATGMKVVAVDLDPQAHLTIHLGLEPETVQSGSYGVLTQAEEFEHAVLPVRQNLWLLPANINLVGAESELVSVVGRETILREAIRPIEDKFDYLIIDCPPSLGLLTLNALAAVDEILIPLQPHFLALQGFGKLLQTVELVNRRINPKLKVEGILLCMYDSRASLPKEVKADIEQFLDKARGTNCAWAQAQILPVCIRRNIKLAEAPSYGKTIFEYEQNCHGAQDYKEVAAFIHGRELPEHDRIAPATIAQETDKQSVEMSDQTGVVETQPESSPPAPETSDQQPSGDVEGPAPHVPFEIRTIAQPDSQDISSQVTPHVTEQDTP
jgi:chromosome partitioning protein